MNHRWAIRPFEIEIATALLTTPAGVFSISLCNGYTRRGARELVPDAWRPVGWQYNRAAAPSPRRKLILLGQIRFLVAAAADSRKLQRPRIRPLRCPGLATVRDAVVAGDVELRVRLTLQVRTRATGCGRSRWRWSS